MQEMTHLESSIWIRRTNSGWNIWRLWNIEEGGACIFQSCKPIQNQFTTTWTHIRISPDWLWTNKNSENNVFGALGVKKCVTHEQVQMLLMSCWRVLMHLTSKCSNYVAQLAEWKCSSLAQVMAPRRKMRVFLCGVPKLYFPKREVFVSGVPSLFSFLFFGICVSLLVRSTKPYLMPQPELLHEK